MHKNPNSTCSPTTPSLSRRLHTPRHPALPSAMPPVRRSSPVETHNTACLDAPDYSPASPLVSRHSSSQDGADARSMPPYPSRQGKDRPSPPPVSMQPSDQAPSSDHLLQSFSSRPASPLSPLSFSSPPSHIEYALPSDPADLTALNLKALDPVGIHPSCSAPDLSFSPPTFMSPDQLNLLLPLDDYPPPSSTLFSPSSTTPSSLPSPCPSIASSASYPSACRPTSSHSLSDYPFTTNASVYSPRFPPAHRLNQDFIRWYRLGDELGAGGYGFVMTARHRLAAHEVAVKFIIKAKVPEHAWMEDAHGHRVPTEALLLGLLDHPNIVRCLDLFEDDLYFYLVQELHGTPWVAKVKGARYVAQEPAPGKSSSHSHASTPSLTPSPSIASDVHLPVPPFTPPPQPVDLCDPHVPAASGEHGDGEALCVPSPPPAKAESFLDSIRPSFTRRPSHDLFECIEQSAHKRLTEAQARYVFAQIVEAVYYLDTQGVTHCDIKDENILVDRNLCVKLVDFGSAVVVDPAEPRPLYTVFFGTTAYAASEVLQKKPYRAPPAEIWTLGVLLSYLLTGASPFPTERDAITGRVVLHEKDGPGTCVSDEAEDLMLRCLEPEPCDRADIAQVRTHSWLAGALDLPAHERTLS